MSVPYQYYYKVLNVNFGASQDEIKNAFRKLVQQYHPDVNKNPYAYVKYRDICEAYKVLSRYRQNIEEHINSIEELRNTLTGT
ncbi:MAG: DnaJ domain-containing protein [Candidatus Omnitrophica bacterium]|nr:DnaJ domain-containing protein [Candidatus Omnitrophota bacterium]